LPGPLGPTGDQVDDTLGGLVDETDDTVDQTLDDLGGPVENLVPPPQPELPPPGSSDPVPAPTIPAGTTADPVDIRSGARGAGGDGPTELGPTGSADALDRADPAETAVVSDRSSGSDDPASTAERLGAAVREVSRDLRLPVALLVALFCGVLIQSRISRRDTKLVAAPVVRRYVRFH
jgi:hypothetical protein